MGDMRTNSLLADQVLDSIVSNFESQDFNLQKYVREKFVLPPITVATQFTGWVQQISVAGIRAFSDPQVLRLSQGLTIVNAPNGSGKTSLTDAIELSTAGKTTRALGNERNASEVKDSAHVRHRALDGAPSEVEMEVECQWYPSHQSTQAVSSVWRGSYGQPASPAPPLNVISRRRLRELIADNAVGRAERLGVSLGIDAISTEWDECVSELGKFSARVQSGELLPDDVWNKLSVLLTQKPSFEEVRRVLDNWFSSQLDHDASKEPQARAIPDLIAGPSAPISSSRVEELHSNLKRIDASQPTQRSVSPALRNLLLAFRELAHVGDVCQACEAGIVTEDRIQAIEDVLNADKLARRTDQELRSLTGEYSRLISDLMSSDLSWSLSSSNFDPLPQGTIPRYADLHSRLLELNRDWNTNVRSLLELVETAPPRPSFERLESVGHVLAVLGVEFERISATVKELETQRQVLLTERERPDSSRIWALRHANRRDLAADIVWSRIRSARIQYAAQEAMTLIRQRRLEVVDERLAELADPINAWLSILAPRATPSILLEAKPTSGRPALKIYVGPPEHRIEALGRLSDSQLDMLGLATHFAVLEREKPGWPLVIDDPSDMLDTHTRKKLAVDGFKQLLKSDAEGRLRQLIVLTHDSEFVKDLWEAHRENSPATVQDYLEVCETEKDRYTLIISRASASSIQRARELLNEHRQHSSHRLWFRSSLASHVRQAAELFAKDVAFSLGPAGHKYLESFPENSTMSSVASKAIKGLKQIRSEFASCGNPVHIGPMREIDKIREIIDNWVGQALNPGSHADVILPEVEDSKAVLDSLARFTSCFTMPEGMARSNWTTESKLGRTLTPCSCVPATN